MREVRVESLEGPKTQGTRTRLPAGAGSLGLVCCHEVRGNPLSAAPASDLPTSEELVEPERIRQHLDIHTTRPGDNFCRS
jgi:hypothetical protein